MFYWGLRLEGANGIYGVFFYSTFLTSAWVWAYTLSLLVFRLARAAPPVLAFLIWLLPVKKHPFRAMGIVAFVAVLLVGSVVQQLIQRGLALL